MPSITTISGRSPHELAVLCGRIGRELTGVRTRTDTLGVVSRIAAERVPGAEWASVTECRKDRFATVAATGDAARTLDAIQYDAGSGPCVDAIRHDTHCRSGDLTADGRWPEVLRRAARTQEVRSVLSLPLPVEGDLRLGLNLYATGSDAFDDVAESVGALVASHAGLAVAAAGARDESDNLRVALASNREIATAVGVVMAHHALGREEAFALLCVTSQNSNRRLADIATAVIDTGAADLPGVRR